MDNVLKALLKVIQDGHAFEQNTTGVTELHIEQCVRNALEVVDIARPLFDQVLEHFVVLEAQELVEDFLVDRRRQ